MATDGEKQQLRPTALSLADMARLLSKTSGNPITPEMLQTDLDEGAPVNPDGTMNVLHYGAWVAKRLAESGDLRHAD